MEAIPVNDSELEKLCSQAMHAGKVSHSMLNFGLPVAAYLSSIVAIAGNAAGIVPIEYAFSTSALFLASGVEGVFNFIHFTNKYDEKIMQIETKLDHGL